MCTEQNQSKFNNKLMSVYGFFRKKWSERTKKKHVISIKQFTRAGDYHIIKKIH